MYELNVRPKLVFSTIESLFRANSTQSIVDATERDRELPYQA